MDEGVKDIIRRWAYVPTPENILEALDFVIHYGAGSEFIVNVLTTLYDAALSNNNTTHEEYSKIADESWRRLY